MKTNRLTALVLVAVLGLFAAACSENAEDLSDDELRSALIEVLTEDGTLESDAAECTVDSLFENLDRDSLNQLANAEEEADASPEQVEALTEAVTTCLTAGLSE